MTKDTISLIILISILAFIAISTFVMVIKDSLDKAYDNGFNDGSYRFKAANDEMLESFAKTLDDLNERNRWELGYLTYPASSDYIKLMDRITDSSSRVKAVKDATDIIKRLSGSDNVVLIEHVLADSYLRLYNYRKREKLED